VSTAIEFVAGIQDQALETIKGAQGMVLTGVRRWSGRLEPIATRLPALPFARYLPTPEETVDSGFSFAENLFEAQHDFVKDVLRATAPLRRAGPAGTAATKAETRPRTRRPQAKRAEPRRAVRPSDGDRSAEARAQAQMQE